MPNRVKGRQGEELSFYFPEGTGQRLDEARGPYFTRSKFVLLALDRAIREVNNGTLRIEKRNTPLGATVASHTPNEMDSSNTSPNTTIEESLAPKEGLANVS